MRPLIGITCYVEQARWGPWDQPAAVLQLTYVRAVDKAGGRPIVLPPVDDGASETLDALDGLVAAGGADVDPAIYGEQRRPETVGIRPDRDRGERALLEQALARNMPVLAICRGMQLLNVVRGGKLIQHLPGPGPDGTHHEAPGVFARHDVEIAPDSKLSAILGSRGSVSSHHHQAPGRLGAGLDKVAWAPDGTIEGIEDASMNFVVGVLWHPEESEDGVLFRALVEHANESREAT